MSKPLIIPVTGNIAPDSSAKALDEVGRVLGNVPNVFRTVAHSPAALQSMWSQHVAAADMRLSPRVRAAIGLRVAQLNSCDHCLSAHMVSSQRADVDEATANGFRRGQSNDPKEQVLLALTTKIVKDRGHHAGFVVETARQVGVSDAEIIEVIALISLHTFTNYVTNVANTHLDEHPTREEKHDTELPRRNAGDVRGQHELLTRELER
jgi:AhpD family alkylhydroperoxidase